MRTTMESMPPITPDYENFVKPLLSTGNTRTQLSVIERISGRSDKHAGNIATEIVKDMQLATHYPPEHLDNVDADVLAEQVNQLIKQIQIAREGGNISDDDLFSDL